jgi:hypothetical protein
MGEASQRKKSKQALLKDSHLCIFCGRGRAEYEHDYERERAGRHRGAGEALKSQENSEEHVASSENGFPAEIPERGGPMTAKGFNTLMRRIGERAGAPCIARSAPCRASIRSAARRRARRWGTSAF